MMFNCGRDAMTNNVLKYVTDATISEDQISDVLDINARLAVKTIYDPQDSNEAIGRKELVFHILTGTYAVLYRKDLKPDAEYWSGTDIGLAVKYYNQVEGEIFNI